MSNLPMDTSSSGCLLVIPMTPSQMLNVGNQDRNVAQSMPNRAIHQRAARLTSRPKRLAMCP